MEDKNEQIPYAAYLEDFGITNPITHSEFAHFAYMFASNCYNIANQSKMEEGEQLQGHFHWRTTEPTRFFKINFTYFHSYELIFGINSIDELSFEEYLQSVDTQKSEEIGVFNTESTLASNIIKKNSN